jgi:hypothetical protein
LLVTDSNRIAFGNVKPVYQALLRPNIAPHRRACWILNILTVEIEQFKFASQRVLRSCGLDGRQYAIAAMESHA